MPPQYAWCTDQELIALISSIAEGNETSSRKLETLNHILGTFGVEGFDLHGTSVSYLNAGDTYVETVVSINGVLQVGTWGDVVEEIEQQYIEDTPCDFPGTIISGTLRTEDLIDAFEGFLDSRNVRYKKEDSWETEDDQEWYMNEVLVFELEYLAPCGWYFGANPGDGANLGYWRSE